MAKKIDTVNTIAYSTEAKMYIDPYQARELYLEGVITDQRAFICTEPGCPVTYTCRNMYKDEKELKQRLHFMRVGTHNHDEEDTVYINRLDDDGNIIPNKYIDESKDVLLSKPRAKPVDPPEGKSSGTAGKDRTKHTTPGSQPTRRRNSEYGMIMSLVSKFKIYEKNNLLYRRQISFEDKDHYYGHFFENVDKWSENDWNKKNFYRKERIYYGSATVRKIFEKDDYVITFTSDIECCDYEPTLKCYVSKSCMEKRYNHKSILEAFQHYSANGEAFTAYVCGSIKSKKGKDEKEYLNIHLVDDNLNYFHWDQEN